MTIYFISDGEYVKIGYTSGNPKERLASLQTSNARQLKIIQTIPGDIYKEQTLHQRFHHLRACGEWFKFTEEIREFINTPKIPKEPSNSFHVEYLSSDGLDAGVDAWFQRIPKERLNKLLKEVVKCCEQAYRRGFQQGFEVCKRVIRNEHPVEYRKSENKWHSIFLKDSKLSLDKALNNISSQICHWRFTYDYHKATLPPPRHPKRQKILKKIGMDTAMERHCMEFQNASDFMYYLATSFQYK